jgi:hypothetical protein
MERLASLREDLWDQIRSWGLDLKTMCAILAGICTALLIYSYVKNRTSLGKMVVYLILVWFLFLCAWFDIGAMAASLLG